jgi:hypothetical protein
MSIVYLPDNSLEIIADNNDLVKLIKQHIGYEIAQLVEELCKSADREQIRADSDLLSYESELEDNKIAFDVLDDDINLLLRELSTPRINREKIRDIAKQMKCIVQDQM